MTPTQTFENYPEFANAGQKSQPNDAKYAAGFIPSDVLPAEWLNWFLNGATKGVTALNAGVRSVEQEINAVLESRAVTPDINAAGQLLAVLNKMKAEAVLAAHPVGSLYWTSKNENPSVTFGGGTWKQIKDKFVLAAGDSYKEAGATGGASSMTLGISNIPAHSHSFTPSGNININEHSHRVEEHSHTINNAKTSSTGGHWHKFFTTDSGMGSGATPKDNFDNMYESSSPNRMYNDVNIRPSGSVYAFPPEAFAHAGHRNTAPDAEGAGYSYSYSKSYFWSESAVTSWSGYHNHTVTGLTDTSSPLTTSTKTTGVFHGFAGTTGSTGGTSSRTESFSILPPYVVKYCWERTA